MMNFKSNLWLPNLRQLTKHDLEKAVPVLTSAFEYDPCLEYILNTKNYPYNIASLIHKYVIKSGLIYGHVFSTSENMEAVSVWLPPNKVYMSIWNFIRAGGLSIPLNIIQRMNMYDNYAKKIHHKIAINKHWYLFSIGVHPSFHGKSYGSNLLKPMFEYMDKQGEYCYLETHNSKNIPFYERQGFVLKDATLLPNSNTQHFAMYRSPRDKMRSYYPSE